MLIMNKICKKIIIKNIFTLDNGCTSWRFIMHKCIAQSTTKTKYEKTIVAAKEVIQMNRLFIKMRIKQKVVNLHCDNQSCCKSNDGQKSEIN